MIPEEIYKRRRRHNNTPASVMLIITNYIVCSILFTSVSNINWFFIVVIAGLTLYNVYIIRRNREEYNRANIIALIISMAGIVFLYFVTRPE